MEYLEIKLADLKAGQSALMLFASAGFLVGCTVERRPDGSLHKSAAARCDTGEMIRHMANLFATLPDSTFRVIIDQGGYWPNQFPALKRLRKSLRRSVGQ